MLWSRINTIANKTAIIKNASRRVLSTGEKSTGGGTSSTVSSSSSSSSSKVVSSTTSSTAAIKPPSITAKPSTTGVAGVGSIKPPTSSIKPSTGGTGTGGTGTGGTGGGIPPQKPPTGAVVATTSSSMVTKKSSKIKKIFYLLVAGSIMKFSYDMMYFDEDGDPKHFSDGIDSSIPKEKVVVLGTGWGAISCMRNIDLSKYDVICISPRNYFLMTPLLPSVSVGTVETRTVCESVRTICSRKINYIEAECFSIDPNKKKIICNQRNKNPYGELTDRSGKNNSRRTISTSSSSIVHDSARERNEFQLEYDKLIIAVGAENQTFNTKGVEENAHFLKELPDARRIRAAVSDCFESALQPGISYKERKKLLNFVVVGGGPTGVEFAAELCDLIKEDLTRIYGKTDLNFKGDIKITLIEAMDKVLCMYDKSISEYTADHFERSEIRILNNTFVKEVCSDKVKVQKKGSREILEIPCGMTVWATGIKTRPVIDLFRKTIGLNIQNNFRGLLTDQHMGVLGCEDVYAIGDCATIKRPLLKDSLVPIFTEADTEKRGKLNKQEFRRILKKNIHKYPQLELFSKSIDAAFDEGDADRNGFLDIREIKTIFDKADSFVRALPATAQVAAQEGKYLGSLFNNMATQVEPAKEPYYGEKPFKYQHNGSLAYIGSDEAIIDTKQTNGLWEFAFGGKSAYILWRSFYLSEVFTTRTKILLFVDWIRTKCNGRDISRV